MELQTVVEGAIGQFLKVGDRLGRFVVKQFQLDRSARRFDGCDLLHILGSFVNKNAAHSGSERSEFYRPEGVKIGSESATWVSLTGKVLL